ncbi:tetratricopeptide repeat protein [Streptomyces sp. NBC_01198]|uniref:tetratricopeptide repeat protein n=1 Tax=Streptomyces sp. NBC_01198 TaxID=2903769 RepID=UPI002E1378D8|nr:tetratricopeptide repeat protein [Streptomyces sp. NBC_01198]
MESSNGGVAVGRAHTFNHYQSAAPLTPLPLPHRIGRVPALAPHFQQRELTEALSVPPGRPLILTGTAGTGKTQLAVRYAETAWERGELQLLLWVADAGRETVTAAYVQAAQDILGRYFPDPAEGAQAFLNWLRPAGGTKPRPWLIVLDGVTEPAELAEGLWPPASPVGRVLVTSSRRDFDRAMSPVIVPVRSFTDQEAAAYLERALGAHRSGPPGSADVAVLAERLGALPASLALAVRHIAAEDIDVKAYLRRLEDRGSDVSAAHAPLRLTIDAANRRHPAGVALPLLQFAAVLAEEGAPKQVLTSEAGLRLLTWLRASRGGEKADRAPVTADDVTRATQVLYDLSLVDRREYLTHVTMPVEAPVRRDVLADVPAGVLPGLVYGAAEALLDGWPEVEDNQHFAGNLRTNAFALLWGRGDGNGMRRGIHPVAFRAGRSAGEWGQFAEAQFLCARLAAEAADVLGADHPDVLKARACAARWRGEAGDTLGAIPELAVVREVQERLGALRPDTLMTRFVLARFARMLTDAGPDAMAALRSVLDDRTRVLGPEHLDTLRTRAELLFGRLAEGHREGSAGAFALLVDAEMLLADVEAVARPGHQQTIVARHLLSVAQLLQDGPLRAAEIAAQAVADARAALGPEHPVTLDCRKWAAYLDVVQGKAKAGAELTDLLADQLRLLGPDHPGTLSTRGFVAVWRENSGDTERAFQEYLALLADRRRVLGPDHPRTLETLHAVADHHSSRGDAMSAVVALSELVSRRSRVVGPDHLDTLSARSDLGRCRGEAGDPLGAVIDLAAVAADQGRILGPDHDVTLLTRHKLAWYRGKAGDAEGAVAAFTDLVAERRAALSERDPRVVDTGKALTYWRRLAHESSTGQPPDLPAHMGETRPLLPRWRASRLHAED